MIKMRKIMIMMMILALVTMRKMALEKGSTVYSNAAPTTMTLMTLRMIMMTMTMQTKMMMKKWRED